MTDNDPEQEQGRRNDPTTMRIAGIGVSAEPLTGADAEVDATLSAQDQATVDALRHGTARPPNSDLFLDDVTVSRRHATFRREGDVFLVRDVGSLNGTYVNRERIDEATLKTRDEVQIGKFRLVFYAGAAQ